MSATNDQDGHRLVQLPNGTHSIYSEAYGETCHPAIGPLAEAEMLYVRQIHLVERLQRHVGEFVIWDVGLGGAGNVMAILHAARDLPVGLRIVSFDQSLALLQFALHHAASLHYFGDALEPAKALASTQTAQFRLGQCQAHWQFHLGDFPNLVGAREAGSWPKPHLILFDPYSPRKNPAMWTAPLFAQLFRLLDPARVCVMPTYSRSTMLRVALLLAGFFVGIGQSSGAKEETTLASNALDQIPVPLGTAWLARLQNSTSAEPLWEPTYRQKTISAMTWEKLSQHAQFRTSTIGGETDSNQNAPRAQTPNRPPVLQSQQ